VVSDDNLEHRSLWSPTRRPQPHEHIKSARNITKNDNEAASAEGEGRMTAGGEDTRAYHQPSMGHIHFHMVFRCVMWEMYGGGKNDAYLHP
jgi:hypothetical protein